MEHEHHPIHLKDTAFWESMEEADITPHPEGDPPTVHHLQRDERGLYYCPACNAAEEPPQDAPESGRDGG